MAWNFGLLIDDVRKGYSDSGLMEYWVQEQSSVTEAITAISESIDSERYNPKEVLGVGGSGIVIRFQDSKFPKVDKAIKFPRPVPGKVELVASLLNKEIQYLAEIRHPRIIRVLDYNCLQKQIGEYPMLPFYLMDYIDGDESRKYVKTHPTVLVSLIDSISGILRYLHSFPNGGFAHLDIKPGNFVVTSDGRVIMIDLGTCKRLVASKDSTTVACTRSFAHPELIRKLYADPSDEKRAKGDIPRDTIDPKWDLWSFAYSIISWLGIDHQSGRIEYADVIDQLDSYTRKYLFLLSARIIGANCPTWLTKRVGLSEKFLEEVPILTASELCEVIGRLSGSVNTIQQIPEMSSSQTNTIQAAPSQHIVITSAVKQVLEHRLFRRLNSITQLGLLSQVYPSAKHSRKEHCLGTYANICRLVKALYDDQASPLFRQLYNANEIRALLLTSLLHDLGQFPLAHDLEEIDKGIFNHGDLTIAALKGAWDKKEKGCKKINFVSLGPVFKEWGVKLDQILNILSAKPLDISASVKDKLLRSLLSGPIDADKLDYLLRDGRQLDLPYPKGVDVERLFVCVTTVIIDKLEGGLTNIPSLGIQAKGKVSADFLTLARYAMFSQAYWHHTVRAQKAMLFRAVEALIAKQNNAPKLRGFQSDFIKMVVSLPESLYMRTPLQKDIFNTVVIERPTIGIQSGSNLAATDAAVLSWLHGQLLSSDQPEAMLIEGILSRTLFKRLWVISRDMEPVLWDKLLHLWNQLEREQRHKVAHKFEEMLSAKLIEKGYKDVTLMTKQTASDIIDRATRGRVPWLLIDIPGTRPGSDVPLFYVHEGQRRSLRKDDRSVGSLQKSNVWDQYAKNLLSAAGKVRVFCDPKLGDSVETSIDWHEGVDILKTSLEQVILEQKVPE